MRLSILGYIKLTYTYTNKNKEIALSAEGVEATLTLNPDFLTHHPLKIFLASPIKQADRDVSCYESLTAESIWRRRTLNMMAFIGGRLAYISRI